MANDLVATVLSLSETLTIAIAPHSALGSDWAVAPNAARPISTEAALANNVLHGTARQHPRKVPNRLNDVGLPKTN